MGNQIHELILMPRQLIEVKNSIQFPSALLTVFVIDTHLSSLLNITIERIQDLYYI